MKKVTISVIGDAKIRGMHKRTDIFFISLGDIEALKQNTLLFSILEERWQLPLVVSAVIDAFSYASTEHVFIATRGRLAADLSVDLKTALRGKSIRVEHVSTLRLFSKHQLGFMDLGMLKSYARKIIETEHYSKCEETRARNSDIIDRTQVIYDGVRLPMNFGDSLWNMPEA